MVKGVFIEKGTWEIFINILQNNLQKHTAEDNAQVDPILTKLTFHSRSPLMVMLTY
jgi:hypothetical protein